MISGLAVCMEGFYQIMLQTESTSQHPPLHMIC